MKYKHLYVVAECVVRETQNMRAIHIFRNKYFNKRKEAQQYFDELVDKYFPLLAGDKDYNNNDIEGCKKHGMFASAGLLPNRNNYIEIGLYMEKAKPEESHKNE